MYIDSHCHLNYPDFLIDQSEVIKAADEAGVKHIIVPGTNLETSQSACALAKDKPNIHAAVGYHPNDLKTASLENLQQIAQLAARPEVVAIGEVGLDYYRNSGSLDDQRKVLQYFLSIAAQEKKPVIIHARAAADDVLDMLYIFKNENLTGVWHCFEGDWNLANRVLDLGFYLGFTGNITFSPEQEIHEVIKNIPLERILIETDAPFLAPTPHRGQRNQPAFVVEVARKIADLTGNSIEEVGKTTANNAIKLFNL